MNSRRRHFRTNPQGPRQFASRFLIACLLLLPVCIAAQTNTNAITPETMKSFDCSPAPVAIQEIRVRVVNGITIRDIQFDNPGFTPITASLVIPPGKGPFPAVVYQHWGDGTRAEFLAEALLLARANPPAISLLLDAPFARPAPLRHDFDPTKPGNDRTTYIESVVDIRRSVQLLLARSDVSPNRIAYVGHSFGATIGGAVIAFEPRFHAFILMAGFPSMTARMLSGGGGWSDVKKTMSESQWNDYVDSIRVIDADQYLPRARAGSVLLQFATDDKYISADDALEYEKALTQPQVRTYYTSHEMFDPKSIVDRADFLRAQIGVGDIRPALKNEFNIR